MVQLIYTKEDMLEAYEQGMNEMLLRILSSKELKQYKTKSDVKAEDFDTWLKKYCYENKIETNEIECDTLKTEYFEMNVDDFNKLVEKHYGGSFEFEAIHEAYDAKYSFEVPNMAMDSGQCEKIRAGKYPMYCAYHVFKCLFEDGHIKAGKYLIDCRH